ncbi:MAG: zinc-binding dehydrogenase [Acidimicrobiales bacterium]
MRAAVTRGQELVVDEVDDPVPGPGQVLVRTLACGICGSDLHALTHLAQLAELSRRVGAPGGLDPACDVVFGHEFCAEVVDFGPGTERSVPVGTTVCSVPIVLGSQGPETVGYSNRYPGGFGELMVLQDLLLLPVPSDVPPRTAALTEPLAVGEHAVAAARIQDGDVCLVIGCGPVGLAVIAALKARGHGPVLAADFSRARRWLAEQLGADELLDPAATSPYGRWSDFGVPVTLLERGAFEMVGAAARNAVIFEAVGSPGVLQAVVDGAPPRARIVVVGVCMEPDEVEPFVAVAKELEIRFSFGYSRDEFAAVLDRVGQGAIAVDSLVTGTVGLDGVAGAFRALGHPDDHVKILVQP